MTRTELLTALRQNNPAKADYTDEELLWDAGEQAQADGVLDQYPVLQTEMIRQKAAFEANDRSNIGNAWAGLKRGFARGAQGMNATGEVDETDAKDIARWEKTVAANPNSPEYNDFMQAKGFVDSAKAFGKAPVRILSELMAESAAQSLPAMGAGFLGGAAQGAVVGAPTGPGEGVTIPVGAMIGTALGSGYVEYSSKLLDVMQQAGMDISDPESVKTFFNNPTLLANARELAVKRAIPVGLFDGVTVGMAHKFAAPVEAAWKAGEKVGVGKLARQTALGVGSEMAGGMLGEAGGQLAAGEDFDPKSIAVEGLAEIGSLPSDVISTYRSNAKAPTVRPVAAPVISEPTAKPMRAPMKTTFNDVVPTVEAPAAGDVTVNEETLRRLSDAGLPAARAFTQAQADALLQDHADRQSLAAQNAAKNAPVLADMSTQEAMVATGEVQPNEAATFTQSQANAFLQDYADRQAAAQELVDSQAEADLDARIEQAAAAQSAARNLAAQQAAQARAQMEASHEALAEQQRQQVAAARQAQAQRVADVQSRLAAQRAAVNQLGVTENEQFQQLFGQTAPLPASVPRNVEAAGAKEVKQAARQQTIFTKQAAKTVGTVTPVETAPITTPLTGGKPTVAGEIMAPKAAEVSISPVSASQVQTAEPSQTVSPVTPVAPVSPVTPVAPVVKAAPASAAATPEPAPVSRFRDELVSNKVDLNRSVLVDPNQSMDEVFRSADKLSEGNAPHKGGAKNQSNALLIVKDPQGEYYQVPVKANVNKRSVSALVHPTRQTWMSWVSAETGVKSLNPYLLDNPVGKNADTVARVKEAASKYGFGKEAAPDVKAWLAENPHLQPVMYLATEQATQPGLRKADPSIASQIEQTLVSKRLGEAPKVTAAPVAETPTAVAPASSFSAPQRIAMRVVEAVMNSRPGAGPLEDMAKHKVPVVVSEMLKLDPKLQAEFKSLPVEDRMEVRSLVGKMLLREADLANMDRGERMVYEKETDDTEESDAASGIVRDEYGDIVYQRIEAQRDVPNHSTSGDYLDTTDRYSETLRNTAALGLNVNQREATAALKAGGAYNPSTRQIWLTLANLLRPTKSNLLSLVHEVVHDITEQAPEPVRRALHDAFARIPAGDLAFYGNPLADPRLATGAGLSPEQHITEKMVEHLSIQGIDRNYSQSIIAQAYRTVKDALLNGAMYLQSKLLGKDNVSGVLAKEWAENRVAAFLAGDQTRTNEFLAQFGFKPKVGTVLARVSGEPLVATFDNGRINYRPIGDIDAAKLNIDSAIAGVIESAKANGTWNLDRDVKYLTEMLGPDVMAHEEPVQATQKIASLAVQAAMRAARTHVAAYNEVIPHFQALLEKVKAAQPVLTDAQRKMLKNSGTPAPTPITTIEELARLLGVSDPAKGRNAALAHLSNALEFQFGETLPASPVDIGLTIDQLGTGERAEADKLVARHFSALTSKTLGQISELRSKQLDLEAKEPLRRATIQSVMGSITDTKKTIGLMLQDIESSFEQMRRDLKRNDKTSVAYGEALATFNALEGETENKAKTLDNLEKALNSVDVKELPLGAALRELYALDIDLEQAPVTEIRSRVKEAVLINEDSPLAALVSIGEGPNAGIRGTALLASMIRFVKQESLMAEILRAQMSNTKESLAQLTEIREMYNGASTEQLSALAEMAKGLKPTSDPGKFATRPNMNPRLAYKMLAAMERAQKEQVRLADTKRKLSVLNAAAGAFADLGRQSEQRLEVGRDFVFHSGAKYLDPADADTTEDVLTANPKTLDLSGKMTPTDLRELINRTQEWINARADDPSKQGEVYQTLVQQNRVLRANVFGDKLHKLTRGLLNGRFAGLSELFIKSGTRSGEAAARMLTRFDGVMRIFGNSDSTNGQRFETLRDNVIRTMGIDPKTMTARFYNPALWFMQNFQGTEAEAFAQLRTRFASDPITAEHFTKPGAAEVFFAMLRDVKKQNEYMMQKMHHAGADRVMDEDLGGRERTHIERGVAGYTIPQNVASSLKSWLHSFNYDFAIGDSPDNPFREAGRLLATPTGTEQVRAGLAKLFDADGWSIFLRPLLENELGGVPRPVGSDGVRTFIDPVVSRELLHQSGEDLLKFADAAFERFGDGTPEGQTAYREALIKFVNSQWSALDTQLVDRSKAGTSSVLTMGVPDLAIDSRSTSTWPQQWLEQTQYTPGDHRRMTHTIAATGVFGRGGKALMTLADNVDQDLSAQRTAVKRHDDHGTWDKLKKENPEEYKRLQDLKNYAVPEWKKIVNDVFNTESDAFVENKTLMEVFNGMLVGMTAGMKSALRNIITGANLLYLQRSVSGESFKTVGGAYAKLGKLFLAAHADVFGVRLFRDDPTVNAMVKAGVFDSATRTTIKDLVTGERGVNDNLSTFAMTLRRMRNVMVQARLSPLSKDSPFPAMRLLNPFQFTQVACNMANTWQLIESYHELAQNAAEFYRQGGNKTKTLTAKDCGMSDSTRFEALRARMLDNGLNLEDLGQRAATGKNIIDTHFIQACNNISSGDLANEGSINNRPVVMSRSRMGRTLGTFVGWSIAQTQHPLRLLADEQGRTDLKTLAKGTKVLALGLLPMSLAFSAALDEWDELVERKSNRRPIKLSDPLSISEAVVNVGTIGMLGDALDFVSNTAQGTGGSSALLSLDNRIVLFNSANAMITAARNAVAMGDVNYANVARPLLQGMGAGGLLQNAYLMDKVLHLRNIPVVGAPFAAESSVVLRSNIGNYLRAAGREAGLEVRAAGGGGYTPTPMTPHITDMYLAALSNDREAFQAAYRAAIKTAQERGEADPLKKVQEAYSARNPLRSLFNGTPTASEVQRMMAVMPEAGQKAVRDSLRLYNNYGSSLGVQPFMGSLEYSGAQMARARAKPTPGLLDELRSKLADARNLF